mgnify:CR=1 FL=1
MRHSGTSPRDGSVHPTLTVVESEDAVRRDASRGRVAEEVKEKRGNTVGAISTHSTKGMEKEHKDGEAFARAAEAQPPPAATSTDRDIALSAPSQRGYLGKNVRESSGPAVQETSTAASLPTASLSQLSSVSPSDSITPSSASVATASTAVAGAKGGSEVAFPQRMQESSKRNWRGAGAWNAFEGRGIRFVSEDSHFVKFRNRLRADTNMICGDFCDVEINILLGVRFGNLPEAERKGKMNPLGEGGGGGGGKR